MSYINNPNENNSTNQMLLFMALAMGGFALYVAFFAPTNNPEAQDPSASQIEQQDDTPKDAEAAVHPDDDSQEAIPQTDTTIMPPYRLRGEKTKKGAATFFVTNVGGRVASLTIDEPKQYRFEPGEQEIYPSALTCEGKDAACRTDDLASVDLPLALTIPGLSALKETTVWEVDHNKSQCTTVDGVQDCSLLVMNWAAPDGSFLLTRSYRPTQNSPFGLQTSLTIHNQTGSSRTFEDLGIKVYGNWSEPKGGMFNRIDTRSDGICGSKGSLKKRAAKKLNEAKVFDEKVGFAGINERYFVSAIVATNRSEKSRYADRCIIKQAERSPDSVLESILYEGMVTIPAKSETTVTYEYVAAPKRIEFLKAFDADLQKSVEFGMFSFLAYGIRWFLVLFHSWVGNWGIAILLLTFTIKLLLLPVTTKAYRSMEKMKGVQPKIEELKKKYENDQQKLAEAQMRLFKEEGVNPLSGCLPLLLQMPIYFALYRTIFSSAELFRAPFLGWITDLSQSDPYFILPVITSLLMVAQVKFTPQSANMNPQMKMMQWIMPVMFIPVTLLLPAGLVLYMLVNMALTLLQQIYIRRTVSSTPLANN